MGCDMVALSFVRDANDVKDVHKVMDEEGRRVPVIAKVEKPQAVDNMEDVVMAFDAVMVARGDLGRRVPAREGPDGAEAAHGAVPPQRQAGDRRDPDDGVDDHQLPPDPRRGVRRRQRDPGRRGRGHAVWRDEYRQLPNRGGGDYVAHHLYGRVLGLAGTGAAARSRTSGGAIVKAAKDIGDALGAVALVAFSQTGDTARRLSRLHPGQRLLVFTPDENVHRQMALQWGAEAHLTWTVRTTDEMVRQVDSALVQRGVCHLDDLVIIVAGTPPTTPGATNTIRLHHIGDVLQRDR